MRKVLCILFFCLGGRFLFAQQALLTEQDVALFVETFPALQSELETLEISLYGQNKEAVLTEALADSNEVQSIFLKYGWNDSFFPKIQTIMEGWGYLIAEESIREASPELEAALVEIEAMPISSYFTLEMKNQMREQILAAFSYMDDTLAEQRAALAPQDMEILRGKKNQLDELFVY